MMKRLIICLTIFSALMFFGDKTYAVCEPGTSWTASWTDDFSETTYQLTAPCKVYLTIPFDVTATVTDSSYPNDSVSSMWSITDTPDGGSISTIASGNWLSTAGGTWTRTVTQTYTGTAVNHTIQFNFIDLGHGGGAHFWARSVIGDLTVDPLPPALLGKMSRQSRYLSPEGWIVRAYTEPESPNEVYIEVIDTGNNVVDPSGIAGMAANPMMIATDAAAPEVSLGFDKTTRTAHVTYTSAAGRQVLSVTGIQQAP